MESFCYHGIGENLLKYESIMKNGILSTQRAQNIDAYNKNGGVNHNGNDRISVAVPHDINQWGALNLYILENGISFKVQDCPYTLASATNNSSEYFDEAFIDEQIPVENISGIIVNSELRTKKIRELSTIGSPANNEVVNISKNIIRQLQAQGIKEEEFNDVYELIDEYTTIFNNTNLDFLEQDKQLLLIRKKIDSIISMAVEELYKQRCGKEDVSVLDIIELYNDKNLPIYDENDIIRECNGKIVKEFSANELDTTINENQEVEEHKLNAIIESEKKPSLEYETIQFQEQEKSLTVIPEKKRITTWFKEKWILIKERFSNHKNIMKKHDEKIESNNSNKGITSNLKNLKVNNKNNQIEKKALESIKRKEQFEIAKKLAKKKNIETNNEKDERY
ncbi:MAG: hypothetical protein HFJ35_07670 [Clostridia bacterium]|nr:hypothetical protein [Clostridia bacterium]